MRIQRFRELATRAYASVSRRAPEFRGKYSIGKLALRAAGGDLDKWQEPEFFVKLKTGHSLRIDVRSETHLAPLLCGTYDSDLIQRFTSLFEPGWVVLDIGANIGYYSIPFGHRLKELGEGAVYSFEPVAANFEAMRVGIEKNGLGDVVHPQQVGLGERNESVGISMTEGGNTGNAVISTEQLVQERGFEATEQIQLRRLDELQQELQIPRCDFIKIDVEGAEIVFLRGAREFLKDHQPILYGEFNSYFMERTGVDIQEAWDFFMSLGYTCLVEDSHSGRFDRVNECRPGLCNLLFLPSTADSRWSDVLGR